MGLELGPQLAWGNSDMTLMNRDYILQRMQQLADSSDTEAAHHEADMLLTASLMLATQYPQQGDGEWAENIRTAYQQIPKWYA